MSKTLSKVGANAAVVSIDLDNLNVDAALGALDRAMSSAGMSSGGGNKRMFPGKAYFQKKGQYLFGQGKKNAVQIDDPTLAVNVAHLGAVWVKFEENESGKVYPKFSELALLSLGHDLAKRDSLGDTDVDEWPQDDAGRPMDPWTLHIAIPCREEGSTEYNHVLATSKTDHNALARLFSEAMQELKLKAGRLPIVKFGTVELSRKVPPKNGKGKGTTQEWMGMTCEIVAWVKAEPCDRLNQNVDMGDDNADVETGKVTATARTQKALPAPTKTEPRGKPTKPTLKKKHVEEI